MIFISTWSFFFFFLKDQVCWIIEYRSYWHGIKLERKQKSLDTQKWELLEHALKVSANSIQNPGSRVRAKYLNYSTIPTSSIVTLYGNPLDPHANDSSPDFFFFLGKIVQMLWHKFSHKSQPNIWKRHW